MEFIKIGEINPYIIGIMVIIVVLFIWFIFVYEPKRYPFPDRKKQRVILSNYNKVIVYIYRNKQSNKICLKKSGKKTRPIIALADKEEQALYKKYFN